MRLPEADFIDDRPGKPAGIQTRIGRHPIAAFGNPDGGSGGSRLGCRSRVTTPMDASDEIWRAVTEEFADLTDVAQATRVCVRRVLAATLGGIVGFEREHRGKSAGMRTHMLVALGAALFVLTP